MSVNNTNQTSKDIVKLERIIYSYHTQFEAAMKAQSLGLCKKLIKHALDDDRELSQDKFS